MATNSLCKFITSYQWWGFRKLMRIQDRESPLKEGGLHNVLVGGSQITGPGRLYRVCPCVALACPLVSSPHAH